MSDFDSAPAAGADFNHAAARPEIELGQDFEATDQDPNDKDRSLDEPHLRYNPPVLVPDGQTQEVPTLETITREELSTREREGTREAQVRGDRFDLDEQDPVELDFNDAARGDRDWQDEAHSEYAAFTRDGEDERNEENTPENAAAFEDRMQVYRDEMDRENERDDHDRDE